MPACRASCSRAMDDFAKLTGRQYHLFDYEGPADAERVLVLMGSGAETARETAAALRAAGEKVGVIQVRLFRPFSAAHFLAAAPKTCRAVAVLERTKEPGAGEPLYLDVATTLAQALSRRERHSMPMVIGGRYGLSSKDFTPAMAKAVFDELKNRRAEEQLHRRHHRRCLAHQPCRGPQLFDRARGGGPCRLLRPRRRRDRRREQEQREDHRRRRGALTRKAISSTIPTNPAPRPSRISASGRSRSARPT